MQIGKLAGSDLRVALHTNAANLNGAGAGVDITGLAGKRGFYPRHAILHIRNNAAVNVELADMQLYAGDIGLGLIDQIGTTAGTPTTLPGEEELIVDCPDYALAKAARFGGLLEVVAGVTPASGGADLTIWIEPIYSEEA